jgi:two-component system response regulator DegU
MEVLRHLKEAGEQVAILVLTVHDDVETICGILEEGATGYLLKDEALETVVHAVRAAARGECWLSAGVARRLAQRARGGAPHTADPVPLPLTTREFQVLRLLAEGLDNSAIAERMVVTTRTVQNYVSAIYGKLGVASRTEAALLAIRRGLVHIPQGEEGG